MASRSRPSNELSIFGVFAGENPLCAGPLNLPDHQSDAYRPSPAFQPDASAVTLPLSDNVEAPITGPVANPGGWATKEAWVQHQAEIEQLYEKKTLAEVMRLMKDKHGFKATENMYKKHIQQWGADKKNKEFEMRAIVRKYKQRKDQGRDSIIHIRRRGRNSPEVVSFTEVVRYWARKKKSIDDVIARQTSSPTPEAVELLTPVPSPITTPQVLAIPERIFRCIRDYFKGSFESGTWVSTDPSVHCHSIKVGGDTAGSMTELCNFGILISSGQDLNIAIAKLNNIFSAEHPTTLDLLFSLMIGLHPQMTDGQSSLLLRLFSDFGKMLLGSEHPLTRICQWSASVGASDFEAIAIRCMESMADQLQSSLGLVHKSTLFARRSLIPVVAHQEEACIQMLQNLLGECEKTLRPDDARILDIRWDIATEYLSGGYYAEAKTWIQKNIAYDQDLSHSEYEDLRVLAKCQYALGEVDLGIDTLLKAINSWISTSGPGGLVRNSLFDLEDWYLEQGLCDAAAQVRELRQDMSELINTDGDSS